MRHPPALVFGAISIAVTLLAAPTPAANESLLGMDQSPKHETIALLKKRSAETDLEISGDLSGLPKGSRRFVAREELLKLHQVTFTVSDDANFTGPTEISGVTLEELGEQLSGTGRGAAQVGALVVAICSDQYRANYPQEYLSAHHPVLALKINGRDPSGWPKDSESHSQAMGPYLISHERFVPRFKILAHADEAQIPWGVVRLEFRAEEKVYGAIAPRGPHAADESAQDGFKIARQNCFRCHNRGDEGGTKAGRPWEVLAIWAQANPGHFAEYVWNPQKINPKSQMPGNPQYDDATMRALIDYFQTFVAKPELKP
jgi:mono/diheme cytochrome c family protein